MGLNVILQTLDGQRHPSWDDSKYSGDRELFDILGTVPGETLYSGSGDGWHADHRYGDDDWVWRPTDIATFRAAAWPDVNPERWRQLADTLEAEPDYWIWMSV